VISTPTSRRTALGGAIAGLVALTSCDSDDEPDNPGSEPTTAPPVDADADLVHDVVVRIGEALALLKAARDSSPVLGRALRPFVELHHAHLAALDAEEDRRSRGRQGDLDAVRRTEATLQRRLVEASVRAESGALAKLLASMAAAIAQHLAVLG
jgi:hypothetical protein